VAAVRKAFGGSIDLDPATSELAQTVVKAKRYYTIADDGLSKPWHGKTFLNPSYERGEIEKWVDKLLVEIASGRVPEAVLLVHSKINSPWFRKAFAESSCLCSAEKRIKFLSPTKKNADRPISGSAFMYYGKHIKRFQTAFKSFGQFYYAQQSNVPIDTRRKMYLYLTHIDGLPPLDQLKGKTLTVR
jgi:hypothetical protein